ncbi:Transposase [Peptoniphilus asaccharolyticus DSM 20463]|uniref:Transposase n=1 Tax=Peptoniphilus asaccharolyticus DSM 20463 TaxID=573058 RepID=A0A1W1V0T0_PEPAS|nr:IS110 family transposase [Peptoniphilus asaccharolyticus]MBL7574438.1 IS110 family transposase [Peptoniphilus asaccharolyticus]MBL7574576.1 IS110 family transposase [Peptoniphilus asaccharolyticus]MBL7574607.1 IS110 family transposase [Peptoniphilus asaccharolyticus]MBL7574703.1 IS110 family transposase [Peptoniphilus asaccharolyticus]MBL7575482.1 IS110 family transposase [Peptoniphilus asaccharolyticus]
MFYLGIDIGKNTHVASLVDDKKKVIFKAFSFSNSIYGAESLILKLEAFKNELEIGMEATGHYWLSLYSYLAQKNFTVRVINPIQTDGWRQGIEIRKRKTDIIDSLLIADLLRYGDFVETSLSNEDYLSLRNLSRFRSYLVSSIGDLKRKTIALLDQVFPEYASSFSNIFGKTSKEILSNFSTPLDFEDISSEDLQYFLDNVSRKKYASRKLEELSKKASKSFGINFCMDSFRLQIKMLIGQISFIQNQVLDVEKEIEILLEKLNSPINTIPGIGSVNAATILGEIGDIKRFSNPSKLVAYAGLDASVSQSGEYESTYNHMSKRGSPYLRRALFQSALRAEFCDPVFSDYYQKKISEGKHHLVATNAVARKLCHTIFAVLTKNEPYQQQS